jgi:uncharacterized protein YgfB (UPF0149 family)
MKTLKISDDVHQKLTALLGELTAQTMKIQTYQDAIEALLSQSVIMPPELLVEIEKFIEKNKKRGFTTKEEFIRDAIRFRLDWFNEEYEYFERSKEKLEKMDAIMDALGAPVSAKEHISEAIDNAIESVFEQYKSIKEYDLDKETRKELEERMKEIEEYWQNIRR